jgi:hypothetical protein
MILGACGLQDSAGDGVDMEFSKTELLTVVVVFLIVATLAIGCQATPTSCPDIESVETVVAGQVFATLTAAAPTSTPVRAPTPTSTPMPYNIYFGDLHVHTSRIHTTEAFHEEFGRGVLRLAHLHAREVAQHDFIAVANHARLLEDWMWQVTLEVADEFTEDGVFVSIPAFEWTASHGCGEHCSPARPDYPDWGHRNIYLRDTEIATPLIRCTDPSTDTPQELFQALPGADLAITIPHHTTAARHPFDWSTVDADYDQLVEIVQRRGDYEADIVENGWRMGHVMGLVGGSDNHIAAAGQPQGITAILAPELTRDALFDALLSRHSYATTHGDIILHFFGDGEMQGAMLSPRSSVELNGQIEIESGAISLVELVDNGEVAGTWEPGQDRSLRFERTEEVGEEPHFFYVRVTLKNGHQAWSSPIWVNFPGATP